MRFRRENIRKERVSATSGCRFRRIPARVPGGREAFDGRTKGGSYMEDNRQQEQRAYQLGEHQLHERKGFNARNLAEAMDAMRTILTEKDEKRGVTYIMAEEAEFIALCLAVRFATDFDGDPDALYRLVRSEPLGTIEEAMPEVGHVCWVILDRWQDVVSEIKRQDELRNSAGAAIRQIMGELIGEGAATERNAAMIRSMLTQAMIDVRREAKEDSKPQQGKVIDFSAFKAKKPTDD